MSSENSKTPDPHRVLLNLLDQIKLGRSDKHVASSNLSIDDVWKNNKFNISPPTWNEEFEWPDGSYSLSDIRDHFEYIIKKPETVTDNPPIMIYIIWNSIKKDTILKV